MRNNKIHCLYLLVVLMIGIGNPTIIFAQNIKDNLELQKMADEDQKARMNGAIDWKRLNQQDSLRRARVFELIKEDKLQTAKDHFNAGIVFQHGNDTAASSMAVKSFERAIKMDSTLNRWWYAAAVDRDLMRRKQAQIYGTQFIQDRNTGKWTRYRIDPSRVTDAARKYYSVETLSEQQEKEWRMNLKPISLTYKENNSIEKTIQSIKEQHQKGRLSAYSLEAELNQFGYELLKLGKHNEALQIFKLNTRLYPTSFNTFDSYGECLMKLDKKKAAIKAYKKSLKLNSENDNVRKIIEANR